MKSIIICEGNTDSYLLQNLMKNAFDWKIQNGSSCKQNRFNVDCEKDGNIATISVAGDSNKISETFSSILSFNLMATELERYKKIILVTDNDEMDTKEKHICSIIEKVNSVYGISIGDSDFNCNNWNVFKSVSKTGDAVETEVALVLIPPDGNGALETFLLDTKSKKDEYERKIINKTCNFVDTVDEQKRYLRKARQITKAKFNVYMSVATANVPYKEQEHLLKDFPWKENEFILRTFSKLKEL